VPFIVTFLQHNMLKSACITFVLCASFCTLAWCGGGGAVCATTTAYLYCATDTAEVKNGDKKTKTDNTSKPNAEYNYTVKGLTVLYENAQYRVNEDAFTYIWDLGDGAANTEITPEYTYPTMGSYRTCLSVMDKITGKVIDKKCKNIEIIDADLCDVNWEPVCGCDNQTYMNACFAENYHGVYYWLPGPCEVIDYSLQCNYAYGVQQLSVQFLNTAVGNYDSFSWNFGNGKTSTQRNPTYTFDQPGKYNVCLTVASIVTQKSMTHCEEVVIADVCSKPK